ncbi:MAG: ABC transporter permease [Actinomycetota bacterium]|nr:ABC transporter permease [Actinomycetota bacterium]
MASVGGYGRASGDVLDTVRRIGVVAGLTFREAWRRKVFVAALVMSLGFLALYGAGLYYAGVGMASGGPNDAMAAEELMRRAVSAQMLNFGLSAAGLIVGLTAVFASVGTISGEIDTGVLHGVLGRPVRREELIAGKFLGLGAMLVVYYTLLVSAVTGLAYWLVGAPITNLGGALALFALEPLILSALAVLGSTRLPTLANGVLCTAAYGIASVGGLIEQLGGVIKNTTMAHIGIGVSLLLPVDAMHRKAISMLVPGGLLSFEGAAGAMGAGLPAQPSTAMVVWAVGYVAGTVGLAAYSFRRRGL